MKRICSVTIITLICSGLAFALQQAVEWAKVDSVEGRFSVLMPSKPQTSVTDVESSVGTLKLHTFAALNGTGNFMLSYADYPKAPAVTRQDAVLDGVRDGVLKGLQAELISESKITLSGYPGRELRARKTTEGQEEVFSWKIFLVGPRLYQMAVVTVKADSESPDIQKFFMSFHVSN